MICLTPKIIGTMGISKNTTQPGCQRGLLEKPKSSANPKIKKRIRQNNGVAAIILYFNCLFILLTSAPFYLKFINIQAKIVIIFTFAK